MHRRYIRVRQDEGDDEDDREDLEVHHHTHHHYAKGEHAPARHRSHMMQKVLAKADSPPEYWETQLAQPDGHMTLVRQEYNELMVAIKSGNVPMIKQELEDLAAASVIALHHM